MAARSSMREADRYVEVPDCRNAAPLQEPAGGLDKAADDYPGLTGFQRAVLHGIWLLSKPRSLESTDDDRSLLGVEQILDASCHELEETDRCLGRPAYRLSCRSQRLG